MSAPIEYVWENVAVICFNVQVYYKNICIEKVTNIMDTATSTGLFVSIRPRDDTDMKQNCYPLYYHGGFNDDSYWSNGNMKIHGELDRLQ